MLNENRSQDNEILALIEAHEPLLRHIIQSRVHNPVDVDDRFQETVLAIIEHFHAKALNRRQCLCSALCCLLTACRVVLPTCYHQVPSKWLSER